MNTSPPLAEADLATTDPIILDQELKLLRGEQFNMEDWKPAADATEEANAESKRHYDDRVAFLIRRQIAILAALRKTGTGPAKAGGKRAKKAPTDLAALEAKLMGIIPG